MFSYFSSGQRYRPPASLSLRHRRRPCPGPRSPRPGADSCGLFGPGLHQV